MLFKEWWYGKEIGRNEYGESIRKYSKSGRFTKWLYEKHFRLYWMYWIGWIIAILIALLISRRIK